MKNTFFILILLLSVQCPAFADNQPQVLVDPDVPEKTQESIENKPEKESLEITASIGDDVKVLASHTIYIILDEGKKQRVKECSSSPSNPCLEDFIPGDYLIKTVIKGFKNETYIKIKLGETNKINIPIGQTGQVEVSTSDTEQGQNSTAFHKILRKAFGGKYKHKISCSSSFEKPCVIELPVGEYLVKSANSQSKKESPFEIKENETTKIHIIFSLPE